MQEETYNSIRVYISCYVWMTGFGNFSFFYTKRDYSFVRFWCLLLLIGSVHSAWCISGA